MKEYGTVSGAIKDRPEDHDKFYEEFLEPLEDDLPPAVEVAPELPHDAISYARDTVDELIAHSDYFIESALEKGIDTSDTSSTEYLRHLYDITNEYLDQDENKAFFMQIDGGETYHAIRLFGIAPYTIRQDVLLDHAKADGHKSGVNQAKSAVTYFNHTMFKLAEANPKRTLTELAEQIELATTFYDHSAKGYAKNVVLQTAQGVRTEYAIWQTFHFRHSPIYTIRHGNVEEDKRGIDFIVGIQDGLELKIDAKSSLQQVKDKAHEHDPTTLEPYTKTEDGQFIYCPQVTEENFMNGSFELDTGEKIKLRNTMFEHLQKMAKLL